MFNISTRDEIFIAKSRPSYINLKWRPNNNSINHYSREIIFTYYHKIIIFFENYVGIYFICLFVFIVKHLFVGQHFDNFCRGWLGSFTHALLSKIHNFWDKKKLWILLHIFIQPMSKRNYFDKKFNCVKLPHHPLCKVLLQKILT